MKDQLKVRALALIAKWKTPGANTSLNRASSLAEAHKILDQLQIQNQLLDRAANWFSRDLTVQNAQEWLDNGDQIITAMETQHSACGVINAQESRGNTA